MYSKAWIYSNINLKDNRWCILQTMWTKSWYVKKTANVSNLISSRPLSAETTKVQCRHLRPGCHDQEKGNIKYRLYCLSDPQSGSNVALKCSCTRLTTSIESLIWGRICTAWLMACLASLHYCWTTHSMLTEPFMDPAVTNCTLGR